MAEKPKTRNPFLAGALKTLAWGDAKKPADGQASAEEEETGHAAGTTATPSGHEQDTPANFEEHEERK